MENEVWVKMEVKRQGMAVGQGLPASEQERGGL